MLESRLAICAGKVSLDEVSELIDRYRALWEIDMLFDILKNACRVEALQLSGIDRHEAIIMAVLDEIGAIFPDETVRNLGELVEHNGAGVALDILCSQIFKHGIQLSGENSAGLRVQEGVGSIPASRTMHILNPTAPTFAEITDAVQGTWLENT